MPTYDNRLKSVPVGEEWAYTSTMTASEPKKTPGIISRLKYYLAAIKWLWQHRTEPNNRHKWRRMMREVQE